MMRPDWDAYFMEIARVVAKRATCDRKLVGAVVVRENRILSTGYNGSPPGRPHCDDVGHLLRDIDGRMSCARSIHAEDNAIFAAARFGQATQGATMYVTAQPCINCAKAILSAGIIRVVWGESYPDQNGVEMLSDAQVETLILDESVPDSGFVPVPTEPEFI